MDQTPSYKREGIALVAVLLVADLYFDFLGRTPRNGWWVVIFIGVVGILYLAIGDRD